MALVVVALVLVVAVTALNLALVLRLGTVVRRGAPAGPRVRQRDDPLPDFAVRGSTGPVRGADLRGGPALLGFFAPGCRPCHENIPRFVELTGSIVAAGGRTLAFVLADAEAGAVAEAVGALSGCETVQVAPCDESVLDAFEIRQFPAFLRYDDGRLSWWSPSLPPGLVPTRR